MCLVNYYKMQSGRKALLTIFCCQKHFWQNCCSVLRCKLHIHVLKYDLVCLFFLLRWNSTYYMLDRLLKNKRAVVLFATETPIVTLTANEWGLMEKVLRLLQPFEEYTKLMSKVNSSLSEVIPAVTVLRKFLSKDDGEKTAGVRTMRNERCWSGGLKKPLKTRAASWRQ